jgi:hypothetical protein
VMVSFNIYCTGGDLLCPKLVKAEATFKLSRGARSIPDLTRRQDSMELIGHADGRSLADNA